jgi:hypothetical protein
MMNGTWVLLISPTSWKKNTSPNVGEPKIELKLQGWCVNANSLSYVSDLNMQCLEVEWNHLVSCFDSHSRIPTKLFYVCHIFVWLCNLSLVGPICGLLVLMTCVEHNEKIWEMDSRSCSPCANDPSIRVWALW